MISLSYEGKVSTKANSFFYQKMNIVSKATNLYRNINTFVSHFNTFSLAENIIVYTPIQGTNREKYSNLIIHKGNMPTLAGNKHLSVHFFFHRPRLLHISTEKGSGLIRQNWTTNWLFPLRHNKKNINKRRKRFSIRGTH